jgi:aspartate/methionine/tyrosine aminotransferase
VAALVEARKNIGLLVPTPVQAALVAALGDTAHVEVQRARYAARREVLQGGGAGRRLRGRALRGGPVPVVHPRRALLGHRRGPRPGRRAGRAGGVLRRAGARHVRLALTATDDQVRTAAERLGQLAA